MARWDFSLERAYSPFWSSLTTFMRWDPKCGCIFDVVTVEDKWWPDTNRNFMREHWGVYPTNKINISTLCLRSIHLSFSPRVVLFVRSLSLVVFPNVDLKNNSPSVGAGQFITSIVFSRIFHSGSFGLCGDSHFYTQQVQSLVRPMWAELDCCETKPCDENLPCIKRDVV